MFSFVHLDLELYNLQQVYSTIIEAINNSFINI